MRRTPGLVMAALGACAGGGGGNGGDAPAGPPPAAAPPANTAPPAAAPPAAAPPAAARRDGGELIGTAAPAWEATEWINSPPLTLEGLRGKVVLVRWFMSTECPYCSATAPALVQMHRDYAGRGLVVIGMYHHKRPEPLTVDAVRGWVKDYGFEFPIAIDRDWRSLDRWWLGGRERDFTSVSFLVDRRGVIRHIHPGGKMAPGKPDTAAMRDKIEELLGE